MIFSDIRKDKHYTQAALAKAIGVEQSTVAMWETGKAVPSMRNLLKLSDVMQVELSVLCDSLPKNNELRKRKESTNEHL